MSIKKHYQKVKGTVERLSRYYYIKLWDKSDWEQEGLITLYQLLESHPELKEDEESLRSYFKVKFSNHVKDNLRRQSSQKRKLNQIDYEEISEVESYYMHPGSIRQEDFLLTRIVLEEIRSSLTAAEQIQYDKLLQGLKFSGRKKLLEKIAEKMRKK